LRLVEVGNEVEKGELIGYVGNTGYTLGPTGCHLHFEVRGGQNPLLK
jgi:murein DD-endopeptidase MepM/ murein hydrolase activator NlpD